MVAGVVCRILRWSFVGGSGLRGVLGHMYAFLGRLEVEASDAIITCIIFISHYSIFSLFYEGSTYSFVIDFHDIHLYVLFEYMPMHLTIPIGDSFVFGQAYKHGLIIFSSWGLGFLFLDNNLCTTVIPPIAWTCVNSCMSRGVNSFMRALWVVGKVWLAFLAYVCDTSKAQNPVLFYPIIWI